MGTALIRYLIVTGFVICWLVQCGNLQLFFVSSESNSKRVLINLGSLCFAFSTASWHLIDNSHCLVVVKTISRPISYENINKHWSQSRRVTQPTVCFVLNYIKNETSVFRRACFCLRGLLKLSHIIRWSHCSEFTGAPRGLQASGWNIQASSVHTVAIVMMNGSEGEKLFVFQRPWDSEKKKILFMVTDWTSTGSLSQSKHGGLHI